MNNSEKENNMKKEAITHGVLEDLANRNENWDKLDGVINQVNELQESRLILKNEIVNGDFSDGTVGWGIFYSANTVNEGILNNTGDGTNAVPITYSPPYNRIGGHKYYVKVRWRVTNSQCTRLYITGFGSIHAINVPVENVWYDTKVILIPPTSSAGAFVQLNHSYSDTTIANGKVMQVKNALTFDLTQIFGAGNEPTKEQMDIIMDTIGYFNGTHTITSKEQFNILLKMVRENALATTSLGGGF